MRVILMAITLGFSIDSYAGTANPILFNCITPAAPIAAGSSRSNSDFDCPHTPQDISGQLTSATDKDYTKWNDILYQGKSTTPLTGIYTKKGRRCDNLTAATLDCPIIVKAKFVYTCDTAGDPDTVYRNNNCTQALNVKVYRATYQDPSISIPGEPPVAPRIVADKGISSALTVASPVSMAQISSTAKGAYKCSDVPTTGGITLFQKGVDAYGNPICLQDTTVEIMRQQICELQMKDTWRFGGSSQDPCEYIYVSKVFKLNNTSSAASGKTTADCIAKSGILIDGAGNNVTNSLNNYPGGTLSGSITSESAFRSKYKLLASSLNSPTFLCKVPSNVDRSASFTTSGNLNLGSDFVDGSLVVNSLYGGGGGGGASGVGKGGMGGAAGGFDSGALSSVNGNQVCSVIIGAGGPGAKVSADYCGSGTSGNPSSISCVGGRKDAGGGGGGTTCGGDCHGGAGGGAGGGARQSCGMGNSATGYGAGGGAGGTCDSSCACAWDVCVCADICGAHSGTGGHAGYAEVSYKVRVYNDW